MPHFPKPFYRNDRQLWYVQVAGKQHNLGPDRDEALERYHGLMRELKIAKSRKLPALPVPLVVALIDEFLDWCQMHQAPRTYEWYRFRLQAFVDFIPKSLTLSELKPYHVTDWTDKYPHWSPGMKRGAISAVQRVFRWAEKRGQIERSPISHIEDKPPLGQRDTVISPEIYQLLLQLTHTQEFRDLLTIAWETGARPQEIIRVEARHVNLAEGRWEFPPKESKGKKRHRIVYLNDTALAITKRLMVKWPVGMLFRNSDGRPWIPDAVNCCFCRLQVALGQRRLRELGLAFSKHPDPKQRRKENRTLACQHGTKYCLYNFRHTFCDNALKRGVDPVTVSVLMGHVDTSMVARRYQHVGQDPEHMRRCLRKATS